MQGVHDDQCGECVMRYERLILGATIVLFAGPVWAADDGNAAATVLVGISAALVFFMQAGFALLESGMVRAKNTINVILKNVADMAVGTIGFWLIGYGLMFGTNPSGLIGLDAFAPGPGDIEPIGFVYQVMFAATAATIVSGAVAERMRFWAYLVGSTAITVCIYPLFGAWAWGGGDAGGFGWLKAMGFIDFAGSTVVHSIGAWAALAAIMVLGPRLGRFGPDGKVRDIPGHNLPLMALGGFILWFGWFGFNGGSVGSIDDLGLVLMNTQLAGASGVLGALLAGSFSRHAVLSSSVINGGLGGLVAITAGAASMDPGFAVVTGLLGGVVAVSGVELLLFFGLDDVVGAISVHGFAGAWGTLAAGLFHVEGLFDIERISIQLAGISVAFLWGFCASWLLFSVLNLMWPLRTSSRNEQRGLDHTEHGELGYGEFQQVMTHAEVRP